MNTYELLKKLAETPGISGMEDGVREVIYDSLRDTKTDIYEDVMGNLIAIAGKPSGYRIGVYAHMDEVGFIVKRIDENGLIRFEMVGNIDERILLGSEVNIVSTQGRIIRGVIGNKSRHLQSASDAKEEITYKKMGIDVGAKSAAEVRAMGIEIGCQIVFATACSVDEKGTVIAKALDNRVSCTVLSETLRRLQDKLDKVELVGIFTVQEEVGARGARTAGFGLDLTQSITLDNVPIPNREDVHPGDADLGNGPVIRLVDWVPSCKMGMISNKKIVNRLKETAKAEGINAITDVLTGTYLDSATAHLTGGGIPSGSLCIPRRYSHSSVEMSSMKDVEQAIDLLCAYILSVNEDPILFGKTYQQNR